MKISKILTAASVATLLVALAACSQSSTPAETAADSTAPGKSEAAAAPHEDGHSHAAVAQSTPDGSTCVHNAPKDLCFICDPSLREEGRLWCREHGRYEDRCWKCHPELEDKSRLYCQEHFLYEDECFLCRPELKSQDQPEAATSGQSAMAKSNAGAEAEKETGLMCREHGMPEAECGICHPELANKVPVGQGVQIRFFSSEAADKAGIRTDRPEAGEVIESVTCYAEVVFNQNKLAQITPLVPGMIQSVEVDLGSRVRPGDLLASLSSLEITDAQSRFLKALAAERLAKETLDREQRLRAQKITAAKDLQEAEAGYQSAAASVDSARQQLRTLGFSNDQIQTLAAEKKASGVLELRAPFAGEIVERNAVQGAMAETGQALFKLADRSHVWAILKIPESQLGQVRKGQPVHLKVEAFPEETFSGQLTWISAEIDHRTRMATARAEFPNPNGRLKANMFATARIQTGAPGQAMLIPDSAVQYLGDRPFAFVRVGADLYSARPLLLGPKENGTESCAVLAGLDPADQVVTQGSFAVKSQFLISRLGAGCVNE